MAFATGFIAGTVVTAAIAIVACVLAWCKHDCRDSVASDGGIAE